MKIDCNNAFAHFSSGFVRDDLFTMLKATTFFAANYMDNWKCTGILKGDGSPLTGLSGQPTAMNTMVGSLGQTSQNALNGMSAGR